MAINLNDPSLPTNSRYRFPEPLEEKESKRQERGQEEAVSSASSVFRDVTEQRLYEQKIFSMMVKEFDSLSPEDIKKGPVSLAERTADKADLPNSGINRQTVANCLANAAKAFLEIPKFGLRFLSECDDSRLKDMEENGLEQVGPTLTQGFCKPAWEKLGQWQKDIDRRFNNNSDPEAYKELGAVLGPLSTVYESSQPASYQDKEEVRQQLTIVNIQFLIGSEEMPIENLFDRNLTDSAKEALCSFAHKKLFSSDHEGTLENIKSLQGELEELERDMVDPQPRKEQLESKSNRSKSSKEPEESQAQKEKQYRWHKKVSAIVGSLQSSAEGYEKYAQSSIERRRHYEAGKASARDRYNQICDMLQQDEDLPSLVSSSYVGRCMRQGEALSRQLEAALHKLEGHIAGREELHKTLQGQSRNLAWTTDEWRRDYKKALRLHNEREKILKRVVLVADIAATAVSGLSTGGIAAVSPMLLRGMGYASSAAHSLDAVLGSLGKKNSEKSFASYQRRGRDLADLAQKLNTTSSSNTYHYQELLSEKACLEQQLIWSLQQDPQDHEKLLAKTRDLEVQERQKLSTCEATISSLEKQLAAKEQAITANFQKFQSKRDAGKEEAAKKAMKEVDRLKAEKADLQEKLKTNQTLQGRLTDSVIDLEKERIYGENIKNIQAAQAEYLKHYKILDDLLAPSKDAVIEKVHQNIREIAQRNVAAKKLLGKVLSQTNHLAFAFDGYFETRVSETIQKPSAALSKATTVVTSMIQLSHAYDQIQSFLQDRQEKHERALQQDPSSQLEAIDPLDIIKFGARLIDPASGVLIAGLEFLTLFKEQDPTKRSEFQKLATEVQNLSLEVREGVTTMHRHLSHVHARQEERFDLTTKTLALFEENLVFEIAALHKKFEAELHEQTAQITFNGIVGKILSFKEEPKMVEYRAYLENEDYRLQELQITNILTSLQTRIEHTSHPLNNGLSFDRHEHPLIEQLSVSFFGAEHCTGLLAQHIGGNPQDFSNFYQYEHYAYIFSAFGSKVLLGFDDQAVTEKIGALSGQLIVRGSAVKELFSQKVLSKLLTNYRESQKTLVMALKAEENSLVKVSDDALVGRGQDWLKSPQNLLQYYVDSPIGNQVGRSLMRSQRFLPVERVHRPLANQEVEALAYEQVYRHMLQVSSNGYYEYLSYTPPMGGSGGDYHAYVKRTIELPHLATAAKGIKQLSLLQLFTSQDIQRLQADQRKAISGNFIEVAFSVDMFWRRHIRLCNNENSIGRQKILNHLNINITFPDGLQSKKGDYSSWFLLSDLERTSRSDDVREALKETERMRPAGDQPMSAKEFSDLFVFSVIRTYDVQTQGGLKGREFFVISDRLNTKAIESRLLMPPGKEEMQVPFDYRNKKYVRMPTSPDGACALHALLGTYQDKNYHYGNRIEEMRERNSGAAVRKHFADTLKARVEEPAIKNRLVEILKDHLNKVSNDPSSAMLFASHDEQIFNVEAIKELTNIDGLLAMFPAPDSVFTEDNYKNLVELHKYFNALGRETLNTRKCWAFIKGHYARILDLFNRKEAILWLRHTEDRRLFKRLFMEKIMNEINQLEVRAAALRAQGEERTALELERLPFYGKTEEEVIAMSRDNPKLLMDTVKGIYRECLEVVTDRDILQIRRDKEKLQAARVLAERQFVLNEAVINRYFEVIQKVQQPNFFFNDAEIELAAMIYNKNVQIVSMQKWQIQPSENLFNHGRPSDPVVVIYHEEEHFERCLPYDQLPQIVHRADSSFLREYDASVNKLVTQYVEFLKLYKDNPDEIFPKNKDSGNPFQTLLKLSPLKVLLSLNEKAHLPLTFPKILLDRIEKDFLIGGVKKVDVEGGVLVPYYSFTLNKEEKCYELRIEYRFEGARSLTSAQSLPEEYCSFVVAQIGRDTVDAFKDRQKHYRDPEEAHMFFHNEFLIQAMYTHLADKQVLPGEISFRLLESDAESVIPVEESFDGIFKKLAKMSKPEELPALTKVTFNYRNRELVKYKGIDKSQLISIIHKPILVTPNKGYWQIESSRYLKTEAHKKKIKNTPEYEKAQKEYLLLKSLLKLVLKASERTKFMRKIHSPDDILTVSDIRDEIYVAGGCGDDYKFEKDEQALKLKQEVLDSYAAHPSTERERLESHLENLKAIARHSSGENQREQLLAIAAHGKAQPFSDYGSYS